VARWHLFIIHHQTPEGALLCGSLTPVPQYFKPSLTIIVNGLKTWVVYSTALNPGKTKPCQLTKTGRVIFKLPERLHNLLDIRQHSLVINEQQQQQQQRPFYGPLSGTTRVSWYQKKHSPTHNPDHHPIFISFFHLPQWIASALFKLCAWQSFCTTSFHVLFGLSLGLAPSASYAIHLFTQSVPQSECRKDTAKI